MDKRLTFTKPPHISDRAWALAERMTLRQLAGQLTSIDPGRYQQLAGEDIALAVARGEIGGTGLVGDRLRELQEIAIANGHPPLLVKDDGRRGFYLVAPFPLYCFDMDLVRRAHAQAAIDARQAGVTLIRLTCDYAFAQNQGRTQEGGIVSCPRLHERRDPRQHRGADRSGRIAVILKHMGPYQYTAGPDYTALPIERTEFLETVLPRYAGGFEAGAHGVMMSFVALNGVPAHADPFLRDLTKASAGPGAIIESDYDAIYELYGGFGYAGQPEGGGAPGVQRGRGAYRPLLAPLPPLPAGAGGGGAHRRGGAHGARGRDADVQGARRPARRPVAGNRPRPRAGAALRPDRRLPRPGARLGGAAAADPARPGRAADPAAPRRRLCVLGPLARRSSRKTGSAAIRATPTAISSASPRRSRASGSSGRRRATPAAATTSRRRPGDGTPAAARGGRRGIARPRRDARRALPRRAAQVERRVGGARGAAAAVSPAPARASWRAAPTRRRS